MDVAIQVFHYISTVSALLLATVAVGRSRRGGSPGRWGAAAFVALAIASVVSTSLIDRIDSPWVTKAYVFAFLAFPYLLLRFSASFGAVRRGWVGAATVWTAATMVATAFLPYFPEDEMSSPGWYVAYISTGVLLWTALSLTTIVALWRSGRGQPTLARRRMRLMGAATGGLNLFIVASLVTDEGAGELVVQILLFLGVVLFALGFAPPRLVRLAWRGPEQKALTRATEELVGATTVSEVTETLLPHVVRIVGGSGAALLDEHDAVVASFGDVRRIQERLTSKDEHQTSVVLALTPPFGALVVATSPLTPFFGHEEMTLLRSLGALADISLARCVLTERERENQTALRLATEEAQRASRAKDDFLSRVSHELRTPLNVVLGFGQILEMGSLDDEEHEAVEQILKAGRHLLEIINEVLDLSRIESGRMAISPEAVELADLAADALDLIRPLATDRSIRLTANLGTCHRHVMADRQRLKQVVLNLLSNAVKYNRDGGEVEVSCVRGQEGRLRLQVTDTGPGIPEKLLDKLFEPFERLGAEQGVIEGTGLGLALSKQLVELMDGEIGVATREGKGSTFWVELSVVEEPQDEIAAEPVVAPKRDADAPAVRRWRVLLVEDNLAGLKLVERLIGRRRDAELLPAMTGRLGLELAREHRPDVILLDQHLPDLRGAEVLQRLKADPATASIPVVMVSADATQGQIRRLLDLGAVAYVTKPLDVTEFTEVLDRIFEAEERST